MSPCQGFENFKSSFGEFYVNMSSIQRTGFADDKILERQAIYQLDRSVVGNLQLFRELSDANRCPIWKALNGEQGLMLLRSQSHGSGRHFTKAQKLAQIVAKSSQFLVFFLRDAPRCALFQSNHRLSLSPGTGILRITHKAIRKKLEARRGSHSRD